MAHRWWIGLAAFALLGFVPQRDAFQREGAGDVRAAKDALEGKAPPPLSVSGWVNAGGKVLKLSDFKGKVVLLDFWGTWCSPCRASMPHNKEMLAKYGPKGFVLIGIHTKSSAEQMPGFVKEQGLTWPNAVDTDGKTVADWKVDSFPDYYLVDRKGNLRIADCANGDVERAVEALLKE